ncbi:MAG: ABC transporter permease, partial [Bdellovibrionales bacterium]|nr:ABC transporter permease [Bdellovibrionales bacterium]
NEGFAAWGYYVRRGFDTLLTLPGSNAVTIFTITVSLFLFSGFLLTLQNVDKILSEVGSALHISAYLKDEARQADIDAYVAELQKSPWVRSVEFVSKEDALRTFRDDLGIHSGFLAGLAGENPLPASIEISLQPDELRIGRLDATVNRVRKNPLVDDVVYGSEWVQHMQSVLSVLRLFGYVSLSIVLVLVVFLIANTIKLVIFSRRDEIGIMQLVGATSGFVRVPFVVAGVIQGLLGSVLAMVFLRVAVLLLNYELRFSSVFGVAVPEFLFLSPVHTVAIILLGGIVGAVGSFFALGRYMNV